VAVAEDGTKQAVVGQVDLEHPQEQVAAGVLLNQFCLLLLALTTP
jgi:hypothetical protein